MADIALDLMEAIDTTLQTETLTGETLEDIRQYFINYAESPVPFEYTGRTPLLIVDLLSVTNVPLTVPGCMSQKTYPIRFTVYTEQAGNITKNTAATLLDLLEDVFGLQTFGVSEWVQVIEKNYAQPTEAPYEAPFFSRASMTIQHYHTDVRTIPTQGV